MNRPYPHFASFMKANHTGSDVFIHSMNNHYADDGQHLLKLVKSRRRITLVAPPSNEQDLSNNHADLAVFENGQALEALRSALRNAASERRALALVRGQWTPPDETLSGLLELVPRDPLIATVQPRFAVPDDDTIWALPGNPADRSPNGRFRRAVVPYLPEITVTPELLAACLLLPPAAVLALEPPDEGSIDCAIATMLTALRRQGFRNVVANYVVTPCPLSIEDVYPKLSEPDQRKVMQRYPDVLRATEWLHRQQHQRLEKICAGAYTQDGTPRLLIDCRGLAPLHNGTAHCMLGFLKGIEQLSPNWEIHVAVHAESAEFHHLSTLCQRTRLLHHGPIGTYLAGVLLNQPFTMTQVRELHNTCFRVICNMLDTIAWDIIYAANDEVDSAWNFIAHFADGLLFNSNFTKERFAFRFSPSSEVLQEVTHHSLCPKDVVGSISETNRDDPYILLIGNSYDHKDIGRTLSVLIEAFPFTRIVAFGATEAPSPLVTAVSSGRIDTAEVDRLFQEAAVVVFPSFYEGFGLPVVNGMACGRTVVARKSSLWREIAAHTRMPGALVVFEDYFELTEAVGRALHGLPPNQLAQGDCIPPDRFPATWRDCTKRIFDLLDRLGNQTGCQRWLRRDSIFSLPRGI